MASLGPDAIPLGNNDIMKWSLADPWYEGRKCGDSMPSSADIVDQYELESS